ncbi:condensation domain-containing protein [Streptomyces sp. NPDC039022]|uniref:condensation domain-containing protein n=1 Tax=Streptomyces sp. NPDC039022 TaxID=3157091 RepID=UPI0033D592F1
MNSQPDLSARAPESAPRPAAANTATDDDTAPANGTATAHSAPPVHGTSAANGTATTNKEKALWLLEQLVPGTGVNNLGLALQVSGRLRPDVLGAALAVVAGRFEVLRTVFRASSADLLKETVPAGEFAVPVEPLELSGGPLAEDLTAFVDRPFPLDGRPLIRVATATIADGDVLCVAVHHLVFDMVSVGVLLQALVPVYDAVAAGRPVPEQAVAPVPALAEAAPRPADLDHWRRTLDGFDPTGLDLWCGTPRGRQPVLAGESAVRTLGPRAQQAAVELQRAARAPMGAVLLAAYAALLAAHGAGPDLVIGSPVDVRGTGTGAIGYHVNVVPIRIRVDLAEGFRPLARQARDAFLGAMAHAHTSVDELAGELPGIGTSWQTQLFRHLFNFLPDAPVGELRVDGMPARLLTVENPHSKFDLELVGSPARAELMLRHSRTLTRTDAEALLSRFEALLVTAAQDPDRPLGETAGWSERDRETVDRANDTALDGRPATLEAAFTSWARSRPADVAVLDGDRSITYGELDAAADTVRELLADAGVRPAEVVAVAAAPGETAAALLGCWRAGAVCLPLDPGEEPARQTRRLTQAAVKTVLTGAGVHLPAGSDLTPALPLPAFPGTGPERPGAPADPHGDEPRRDTPACRLPADEEDEEQPAAVLSHAGIADTAAHFARELGVGPGTGVLSLARPGTFAALFDAALALGVGGRLVPAPQKARTDAATLRATAERHGADVLAVPPGTAPRLLEELGGQLPGLTVLVAGDELSAPTAKALLAADCRLYCGYGAPQTTGWALSGRVTAPEDTRRGRPIGNTRAFVAAPDGRELPVGVRGELCLAGTGTALDTPDGPALPDRPGYGRHHRTGRLAQWQPDGTLAWHPREQPATDTAAGPTAPDAAADDPLVSEFAAIWQQLLSCEVTAQTHFFDAGGHSLLAAVLTQKVEDLTGIALQLRDVFEHPTPAALAARVRR